MKRIDAGWLFAVIIESSRTVESCLSFYHLKMYERKISVKAFLLTVQIDQTVGNNFKGIVKRAAEKLYLPVNLE